MLTKHGVDLSKLNPQIRRGLDVLAFCYWVHKAEVTVTSTYDGKHKVGSKHYTNDAVDTRIDDLDGAFDGKITKLAALLATTICAMAKAILGKDFDIIVESNHIHMEYDPSVI